MRNTVVYLGAALLAASALCCSPAMAAGNTYTTTNITESGVRNVCGKDLQSGGGAIGCTKQCGKSTCDYSCGGPEGKGCRTIVFTRTVTQPNSKTGAATDLTVKQKSESAKPKAASITAGPPKAGLLNDSSGSASMSKSNSKTKNLTTTTTTTTTTVPVTSGGTR